jgi:glycosyltransferase involved in cell wall biosynthesis
MKILVLANCSMGLYKFRKELLEELIRGNNEVYISLPKDEYVPRLQKLGCKVIEAHIDRRGTNPIKDLKLLFFYIKTIKHIKPDVVLTYTIKPNVYGGIACRIIQIPYLANVTGLGTSIENKGVLQKFVLNLYRIGLKKASCVFFQNEPNRLFFIDKSIVRGRTRLIPGSGVNLEEHTFEEYPDVDDIIKFIFVGRIMKAKGIDELLEAAKKVKEQFQNIQFDLVGYSEENYSDRLTQFENLGIIKFHGQQDDVHSFIKQAHATILPSYHEGTANVLLESASTGRPILASRVTGCIETFDEGVSGLGFEVKSVESLIETIVRFIKLPHDKKRAMGINGRNKMEKEFDRRFVINAYLKEINSMKG